MKTIGGIVAWLGGMAILIGALFVLLSLKNLADLFIWTLIGIIVGGFGVVLAIAGWAIYRSGSQEDQARNHRTS